MIFWLSLPIQSEKSVVREPFLCGCVLSDCHLSEVLFHGKEDNFAGKAVNKARCRGHHHGTQ